MIGTFDLAEHADALAEMQIEQERYAAELQAHRRELAHALGLLDAAIKLHAARMAALLTAEGSLADAVGRSVDALDAAQAAGETVREASLLVARVRACRP